ncbi:28S ribosomal protein S30, mitochondrial [Galleria mellonella]|uniref:28S ribosomal protein S30, mitochondrial n=1 Tax=Galleria mellonella TaxID=7137 RepID=A0ABM3MLR6_GALME|nr:28S ribosomal protein S30, mitochondrial [Galleria mellonella]
MHLYKMHRKITNLKKILIRRYSQAALLDQNEYTETPEYPPILDMSLKARKLREREKLHEKIKNVNTVEEKQIALNMPRYYGWKCVMLHEDKVPYNAMPMIQCYTRSHFIPIEKLPPTYTESALTAEIVVKEIKNLVEDAICIEHEGVDHSFAVTLEKPVESQKSDALANVLVKQINRIITNNLADKVPHILSAQVDYDPRHEAFWFVGGVDVPSNVIKWRKQYPWLKDRLDEPVDRPVQYLGAPFLAMRSHFPLKPILEYSEAENPEFKVPKFTYKPDTVGYFHAYRHGTNIPGYWPGDHDEFGLLSYHGRGHILNRNVSFGTEDNLEALHCQAMLASFGWLLAQANYQGFTTYNDLTYPLVTQTIITDGQLWSFYAYQLNTILMHNEKIDENPKHNICFGTKPLKLYEKVENGKVYGFNEDVLKLLVQLYLNTPEEREYDLKPYLGREEQVIADIEDDNKRCWLEKRYKHLVSNRPKHLLLPEIYLWEKIYKIEHKTRFFEPNRRPFELGINPFKRRLNEHLPPYIPKALRPYPKHKKKFETTYYPDV